MLPDSTASCVPDGGDGSCSMSRCEARACVSPTLTCQSSQSQSPSDHMSPSVATSAATNDQHTGSQQPQLTRHCRSLELPASHCCDPGDDDDHHDDTATVTEAAGRLIQSVSLTRQKSARGRVLTRSHAMREESPPLSPAESQSRGSSQHCAPLTVSSASQSVHVQHLTTSPPPTAPAPPPTHHAHHVTQQARPPRRYASHDGCVGSAGSPNTTAFLSRECSGDVYMDSKGVDVHHFLMETLNANIKDQQHLLRYEHDMLDFVSDKSRSEYKFPPQSSYQRMLIHRAAAYFGLDHNVDQTGTQIIVTKTDRTRIPQHRFRDLLRADDMEPRRVLRRDGFNSLDATECHGHRSSAAGWHGGERRHPPHKSHSVDQPARYGRLSKTDDATVSCSQHVRTCAARAVACTTATSHTGRVAKSYSFGGYGACSSLATAHAGPSVCDEAEYSDPPPSTTDTTATNTATNTATTIAGSSNAVLSKQDSSSSSSGASRVSPSSGYKTASVSQTTLDSSPSPPTAHLHEGATVLWAVSQLRDVPAGAVIIDPRSGQPYLNYDGSVYRYDAANPPRVSCQLDNAALVSLLPDPQQQQQQHMQPPPPLVQSTTSPPPPPQQQQQQQRSVQQQQQHYTASSGVSLNKPVCDIGQQMAAAACSAVSLPDQMAVMDLQQQHQQHQQQQQQQQQYQVLTYRPVAPPQLHSPPGPVVCSPQQAAPVPPSLYCLPGSMPPAAGVPVRYVYQRLNAPDQQYMGMYGGMVNPHEGAGASAAVPGGYYMSPAAPPLSSLSPHASLFHQSAATAAFYSPTTAGGGATALVPPGATTPFSPHMSRLPALSLDPCQPQQQHQMAVYAGGAAGFNTAATACLAPSMRLHAAAPPPLLPPPPGDGGVECPPTPGVDAPPHPHHHSAVPHAQSPVPLVQFPHSYPRHLASFNNVRVMAPGRGGMSAAHAPPSPLLINTTVNRHTVTAATVPPPPRARRTGSRNRGGLVRPGPLSSQHALAPSRSDYGGGAGVVVALQVDGAIAGLHLSELQCLLEPVTAAGGWLSIQPPLCMTGSGVLTAEHSVAAVFCCAADADMALAALSPGRLKLRRCPSDSR